MRTSREDNFFSFLAVRNPLHFQYSKKRQWNALHSKNCIGIGHFPFFGGDTRFQVFTGFVEALIQFDARVKNAGINTFALNKAFKSFEANNFNGKFHFLTPLFLAARTNQG